jgi:hypothetical protein
MFYLFQYPVYRYLVVSGRFHQIWLHFIEILRSGQISDPDTTKNIFYTHYLLKGQCHEIFDPRFFSSNNPI